MKILLELEQQNQLFSDPSLTPSGTSEGKSDRLSRLSIYGFKIPLHTF